MTAHESSVPTRRLLPSVPTALALATVFGALLAVTWQRWGHVRIDAGGALDRAARIAAGERLYVDVQSLYPPLADYLLASAFVAFGTRLGVAYAVGGCIVLLQSALLWSIGRRLLDELGTAACLCTFWLYMAFWPGLLGWIVPNTYSMTLGAVLATGTLVAAIAHVERRRSWTLAAASLCAGGATLAKLEFGAAAAGTLLLTSAVVPCTQRSRARTFMLSTVPGMLLVAAVLVPLGFGVGWSRLLWDNLLRIRSLGATMTSLQAAMAAASPRWPALVGGFIADVVALPARGILLAWALRRARGTPIQRLAAALAVAGALASLALPLWRGDRFSYLVAVAPALAFGSGFIHVVARFISQPELTGPIAVSPAIALGAWASFMRRRTPDRLVFLLLSVFAALLVARWGFRAMWYSYYGFLAPLFIVLAARTLARPVVGVLADRTVPVMLLASLVLPFRALTLAMANFDQPLEYPRGRMLLPRAEAAPLAAVVDFVRAETTPGDTVAVLPEERIINFLSERRNPTSESGLGPGWLATEADVDAYLAALARTRPRLIVISKRAYPEFGQGSLQSYAPRVVAWVRAHYRERVSGWYTIFERVS